MSCPSLLTLEKTEVRVSKVSKFTIYYRRWKQHSAMKALASIRKIIITKANCRRRKSDHHDDAASVGLRRSSPSSGQTEQANVKYSEKSTVDGIIETYEAAPPKCIPSINVDASLSSTHDHNDNMIIEAEDIQATPELQDVRRPSNDQSRHSLSLELLFGDDDSPDACDGFDSLRRLPRLLVPTRDIPRRKSMGSLSMSMGSMGNTSGQCPFKHGTVYSNPYPGYPHGNPKRGICPNGCKAEMNSIITEDESTAETMLREAMEFLELYYHERNEDMCETKGFLPKKERMAQVRKTIQETGTYVHTFDELGEDEFCNDEDLFICTNINISQYHSHYLYFH